MVYSDFVDSVSVKTDNPVFIIYNGQFHIVTNNGNFENASIVYFESIE